MAWNNTPGSGSFFGPFPSKTQKTPGYFDPDAGEMNLTKSARLTGKGILTSKWQDAQRWHKYMGGQLEGGYDAAKEAVLKGKSVARQEATDRGQQQQGALQQSAANRGLFNTTVLDSGSQGISAGVTNSLAQIEAIASENLGGLDVAKAKDMAAWGSQGLSMAQDEAMDWYSLMVGTAGYGPGHKSLYGGVPQEKQDDGSWLDTALGLGAVASLFV